MLYLRGATALVGVLLFAVVAGDAWLRPGPSVSPAAEMAPGVVEGPPATELLGKDAGGVQFAPEGTPPPDAWTALSPEFTEGSQEDAELRGTPPIAGTSQGALPEPGEVRARWWESLWLWRVTEGVLGLLFVALLAVTITGARRVRQGI